MRLFILEKYISSLFIVKTVLSYHDFKSLNSIGELVCAKKKGKNSIFHSPLGKATLILCLLGMMIGGIYLANRSYRCAEEIQIAQISEQLSFLKDFSEIAVASEKGWTYPPTPPTKTLSQINSQINDMIDEEIKTLFSKKDLMLAKGQIIKKYRAVKEGEKIEFQLNYSNDKISGTYKGKEGLSIKIDDRRMKITDVLEDHRYLFSQDLADKIAADKCAELDKEWQIKVDDFRRKKEEELIEKVYPQEGYIKISQGLWRHQSEIIYEYVEKKRKEFISERAKAEEEIFSRNKVFGLFKIPREKIRKPIKIE